MVVSVGIDFLILTLNKLIMALYLIIYSDICAYYYFILSLDETCEDTGWSESKSGRKRQYNFKPSRMADSRYW